MKKIVAVLIMFIAIFLSCKKDDAVQQDILKPLIKITDGIRNDTTIETNTTYHFSLFCEKNDIYLERFTVQIDSSNTNIFSNHPVFIVDSILTMNNTLYFSYDLNLLSDSHLHGSTCYVKYIFTVYDRKGESSVINVIIQIKERIGLDRFLGTWKSSDNMCGFPNPYKYNVIISIISNDDNTINFNNFGMMGGDCNVKGEVSGDSIHIPNQSFNNGNITNGRGYIYNGGLIKLEYYIEDCKVYSTYQR